MQNLVVVFHTIPSKSWLKKTLKVINSLYDFIPIEYIDSHFYSGKKFNNCCHISFDDGDISFYKYAFPVLREMKIPASLFVSPKIIIYKSNYWFQDVHYIIEKMGAGYLKKRVCEVMNFNYDLIKIYSIYSLLNTLKHRDVIKIIEVVKSLNNINTIQRYNIEKDQLIEINNTQSITIGAHTINHPILSNETYENIRDEIGCSINQLASMLNKDIRYFAYPNGLSGIDYGFREKSILKENNIKLAFSTSVGRIHNKTDPLDIPRVPAKGINGESNIKFIMRLLLLSKWSTLRNIIKFGMNRTETIERKELIEFLSNYYCSK